MINNGKTAGPPGLISEIVQSAVETGIEKTAQKELLPQSVRFVQLSTAVREKKILITDQILKIVNTFIWRLIRHQVDIIEIQFGVMPGPGTRNPILILKQLQEKYLAKGFVIVFNFEKVFNQVPWDVVWWA